MLSETTRHNIRRLRQAYPTRRAPILMALHQAQCEKGHLSEEIRGEVAALLEVPRLWIDEVVSFYPMLFDRPRGRTHVQVCVTLSCLLAGADRIVSRCREKYGLRDGQVTPDGKVSLQEVQCLASCGTAPVVLLNGERFENLSPDDLVQLLEEGPPRAAGGAEGGGGISSAAAACLPAEGRVEVAPLPAPSPSAPAASKGSAG